MTPDGATAEVKAWVMLALSLATEQVEIVDNRLVPGSVYARPTPPYARVRRLGDRALSTWHRETTATDDSEDATLTTQVRSRFREQSVEVEIVTEQQGGAHDLLGDLQAALRSASVVESFASTGVNVIEDTTRRDIVDTSRRRRAEHGQTFDDRAAARFIIRYREERTEAVPYLETAILDTTGITA